MVNKIFFGIMKFFLEILKKILDRALKNTLFQMFPELAWVFFH